MSKIKKELYKYSIKVDPKHLGLESISQVRKSNYLNYKDNLVKVVKKGRASKEYPNGYLILEVCEINNYRLDLGYSYDCCDNIPKSLSDKLIKIYELREHIYPLVFKSPEEISIRRTINEIYKDKISLSQTIHNINQFVKTQLKGVESLFSDGSGLGVVWKITNPIENFSEYDIVIKIFDNTLERYYAKLGDIEKRKYENEKIKFNEYCQQIKLFSEFNISPKILGCCSNYIIMESVDYSWSDLNAVDKKKFLPLIIHKLKLLLKLGYIHGDLHDGNIMYDIIECLDGSEEYKFYLIDFEKIYRVDNPELLQGFNSYLSKITDILK